MGLTAKKFQILIDICLAGTLEAIGTGHEKHFKYRTFKTNDTVKPKTKKFPSWNEATHPTRKNKGQEP